MGWLMVLLVGVGTVGVNRDLLNQGNVAGAQGNQHQMGLILVQESMGL